MAAKNADEWWDEVKGSHLKALGVLDFETILKGAVVSAWNAAKNIAEEKFTSTNKQSKPCHVCKDVDSVDIDHSYCWNCGRKIE